MRLRRKLGNRLVVASSGGAPLAQEVCMRGVLVHVLMCAAARVRVCRVLFSLTNHLLKGVQGVGTFS